MINHKPNPSQSEVITFYDFEHFIFIAKYVNHSPGQFQLNLILENFRFVQLSQYLNENV